MVRGDKLARMGKRNMYIVLCISIGFLIVAVIIIVALVGGGRGSEGENGAPVHVKSLTCESTEKVYPLISSEQSTGGLLRIVATFDDVAVRTISLQQVLNYPDADTAEKMQGINHSAMNQQFAADGMGADSLRATYSIITGGARFGIYGIYAQMAERDYRYFLLDEMAGHDVDAVQKKYESEGLKCERSN